jgi:Icc-related predicted phosphoesterase
MKIRVLSDLHLEFGPLQIDPVGADLVILAGDVNTKRHGMAWALATFPDQPVAYVAGNHEFYGERFPGLISKLQQEAEGTNVHVLENESIPLGGYRIFGSTLWTDMALFGDAMLGGLAALAMNDYKHIRNSKDYRKLRPIDTRMQHEKSLWALKKFLNEGDPGRSVVVTHHAPSALSLHGHRRDDPVSCAYASNLDDLIMATQPLLWIHGHIHHPQRYMIGKTTILANPRGYHDREESDFDPDLVVDLEELRQSRL